MVSVGSRHSQAGARINVGVLGAAMLVFSSSAAQARDKASDYVSVSGFYSQYLGVGSNNTGIKHPAPSADMELAVRVFSILSLTGAASNSMEPDRDDTETAQDRIRTVGGGLKIDIPGFLFVGSTRKDFRKWAKSSPLNLFIIGEALSLEMKDVVHQTSTYALAGRFGAGLDIYPFTDYSHFTVRYLYLNHSNTGFAVYSFGGGVTF